MKIFLSYPRKDTDKAKALKTALFNGGHEVWMDDQLVTGQSWQTQLADEINRADAIALALTPNWVSSPYCNWEFITAVENNKIVIPVMLTANTQLPARISKYQYADFSAGFEPQKVEKLINDLVELKQRVSTAEIADMNKEAYASQIQQTNSGTGHIINSSGSGNVVAGGNIDQSQGKISIGGRVSGGNVNIGGNQTFTGNTTFNVGDSKRKKDPVEIMLEQLQDALKSLPPEDAEIVEALAQDVISEAQKDTPNKRLVEIKANSFLQTAQAFDPVALIAQKLARYLQQ